MTDAAFHDTTNSGGSSGGRVRVWDPLVRIFHWGLVAAFATAWFTADELQPVHEIAGYTVAGLVDRLCVERVDHDAVGAFEEVLEKAAGLNVDGMFILETFVHRYRPVHAMVAFTFQFLRPLVERAAECDVQFLDAKTNRKDGDACFHRIPQERQGGCIAFGTMRCAFDTRRAAVVVWLNIGASACQHDAV